MEEIKEILKEYEGVSVFNCKNNDEDEMMLIYSKNNIEIRYCPNWDYLEILGLNNNDYNSLVKEDFLGDVIK